MKTVTIGRGRLNDIVVNDDHASPTHCWLMLTPAGWALIDGGSTNGTWVRRNGDMHRVNLGQLWPLMTGDEINVGHTFLPPFDPHEVTPR